MRYFLKTYSIVSFIGLLLVCSCVDQLDFEIDQTGEHLVVDGFITDQCGPHSIRLSMSKNYNSNAAFVPIIGASLNIKDDNGVVYNLFEEGSQKGVYKTAGDVQGAPGMSYTLKIETLDGKKYSSNPEFLQNSIPIDSLYWEFISTTYLNNQNNVTEKKGVQYYLNFTFPKSMDSYFMWQWEETFAFRTHYHTRELPLDCYINQKSRNFLNIMHNENLGDNEISKHKLMFDKIDFRYFLRYSLNAKQYTLSKGAYNFYQQIEKQVNGTGSIFDPTPAQINGNIYNIDNKEEVVLGYFGAFGESKKRTFVNPNELPVDFGDAILGNRGNYEFCIINAPTQTVSDYCYDCRLYPNSTSVEPDFW